MGFELKQFEGSAVSPRDDSVFYDLLLNQTGVIKGCGLTFLGANKIKIAAGRIIVKGRQIVVTEETISVALSTSGTKVGRLYLRVDLSNATNPVQAKSYVGSTLPDLTQEQEFNFTNGIYEMELCNYDVSTTAISNIVITYTSIECATPIAKTLEEVVANTNPNMAAGAMAAQELYNNLGGLSFSQDADGNWGYKAGADAVVPFSNMFTKNNPAYIILSSVSTNAVSSYGNTGIPLKTYNKLFIPIKSGARCVVSALVCNLANKPVTKFDDFSSYKRICYLEETPSSDYVLELDLTPYKNSYEYLQVCFFTGLVYEFWLK